MRWTIFPRRLRSNGRPDSRRRQRDSGASLIEVLIAIVLLGTGVVAMLSTLNVTIQASATERDHANAHAWLQTASDVLYGAERRSCTTYTQLEIQTFYETTIRSGPTNPEGWPLDHIRVVSPVLFWDGEIYQNTCYDHLNINLQLIEIEVRNLDNQIVETVQVVKG